MDEFQGEDSKQKLNLKAEVEFRKKAKRALREKLQEKKEEMSDKKYDKSFSKKQEAMKAKEIQIKEQEKQRLE